MVLGSLQSWVCEMTSLIEFFDSDPSVPLNYNDYEPNFIDAYLCAALSRLCYKESVNSEHTDHEYKNAVKKTLMNWGWPPSDADKTIFINSREINASKEKQPGTQGLIIFFNNIAFICFRGSERKFNDWFSNFNSQKVECPYIPRKEHFNSRDVTGVMDGIMNSQPSVHLGFLKAFNAIIPENDAQELTQVLQSLNGKSIWLTGHSLGGAIASVAASFLISIQLPISGIYTFGAPRVGNKAYRDYLNQKLTYKYWRFMNNHDLVPDIPLPSLSLPVITEGLRTAGFSREGCMLRFSDGSYKILRLVDQDGQVTRLGSYTGKSIKDHMISTYMTLISQVIMKSQPDFPEATYEEMPDNIDLETSPADLQMIKCL